MINEELEIRLKAIELAVIRLVTTISGNEGQYADDMNGHILYLQERIGRGGLEPKQELIFKQALALLDPFAPKPGDEF